jgi:branched-chain amino acid transport system permease protein
MVLVFAVREVIILSPELTGGASGFVGIPRPDRIVIGGREFSFGMRRGLYVIVAALLLLAMAVMHRIDRSRLAKVLTAIRQSEVLAESVGINLIRYRMGAFGIAAFFTSAAGAFSAHYYAVAHPEIWGLWPSIFIITYAIIGGINSVFGPLVGAAVGVLVIEFLRITQGLQGVLLGAALIIVGLVLPGGLTSVFPKEPVDRIRRRLGRSRSWGARLHRPTDRAPTTRSEDEA